MEHKYNQPMSWFSCSYPFLSQIYYHIQLFMWQRFFIFKDFLQKTTESHSLDKIFIIKDNYVF